MRPADFFVVRSPLLEGDGRQAPAELVRDPIVREALERATPSLLDALDGKRPSRGDVWPSITRYLERMRGRCTPFSLMSGYACGTTGGARTRVSLVPRGDYVRVARLDVDAVGRVVAGHARAHEADTLWVAARGVARFPDILRVTSRLKDGDEVRLLDVARSSALDCVLAAASKPTSFAALVAALGSFSDDRAQAEEFVRTVIGERLIVPAGAPPVLLRDELAPLSALGGEAAELAHGARRVRATRLGDPPARELSGQDGGIEAKDRIFDLVKPTEVAELGDEVLSAVREVLAVLPRLTPPAPVDPRLEDFARRFSSTFEGREVPLLGAVDPRRGFGFPLSVDAPPARSSHADLEAWVVTQFERACRARTGVELRESDLLATVRWTYPESFACTFSLAAQPLQLWGVEVARAPGTALFARATAVMSGFQGRARAFLADVARREPEVDFADIAYFVPGKSAAFTQYPQLQPHEITLTPTAGDLARSVDPNELLVSVTNGMVQLRSAVSGRVVRVRTTSAANADRHDTTDLYRFLSALAHQDDASGGAWSWGILGAAERLPRVSYHGHVLSPARWNLGPERSEPLRKAKTRQERWDATQRLRAELELPRNVRFHERHDHLLPVDLDDPYSVEAWLDIVPERISLLEAFPISRSAVQGPEGRFHHQIVLPMLGDVPTSGSAEHRSKPLVPARHVMDRVIPGRSPLFLSYWGDADELLAILRDLVESVVRPREADGTVTHWFFLPYSDPAPHIRLRLFGDAERLWSTATITAIAEVLEPLAAQEVVRKVSFETYDRETYRYGGPKGVELAERVFHLSSAMALDLHEETVFDVESEKELEEVIVPLVASQRALLLATGLPLAEQRALAEMACERYPRHADPAIPRKQGSELYRRVRDALAARVASGEVAGAQKDALAAVLAEARGSDAVGRFDEWFVDCLHVHSIRLLTTWHPIGYLETTAYHVLQKLVGTEIARTKPAA
jgi:thiopeptide-type bacteriocin biosynthesis protein